MVTWKRARVPFGATSSPFLFAATFRHRLNGLQDEYPVNTGILKDQLYVYDLVTDADSTNEAILDCDASPRAYGSKAHGTVVCMTSESSAVEVGVTLVIA